MTMPETPARRRLPLGRGLALSLAVGLSALALGELVARAVLADEFDPGRLEGSTWRVVGRFDPYLGWANAPGRRARIRDGQLDYRVSINSHGFRDPERSRLPARGVRRVVLLGDSVAWGWGVDDGERYADLLDAALGPDIEVLDLAVPGYGTDQALWVLERDGLAYRPDLVLLGFVANDLLEVEATERYGMQKPRYVRSGGGWTVENRPVPPPPNLARTRRRARLGQLVARSALATWIARAVGGADPARPAAVPVAPAEAGTGVAGGSLRAERADAYRRSLERYEELCAPLAESGSRIDWLLGALRSRCADAEVPLVVFAVPHLHDQYLYEPRAPGPDLASLARPFRTLLSRRLAEAGARQGFAVASVDDALLAAALRGERLHCGDGHPNELGSRVVADALLPVVRSALGGAPLDSGGGRTLRSEDSSSSQEFHE